MFEIFLPVLADFDTECHSLRRKQDQHYCCNTQTRSDDRARVAQRSSCGPFETARTAVPNNQPCVEQHSYCRHVPQLSKRLTPSNVAVAWNDSNFLLKQHRTDTGIRFAVIRIASMYLEHVVNRIGHQMKSILDPTFRYVDSTKSDIRTTFARVRREQRKHVTARNEANGVFARRNAMAGSLHSVVLHPLTTGEAD